MASTFLVTPSLLKGMRLIHPGTLHIQINPLISVAMLQQSALRERKSARKLSALLTLRHPKRSRSLYRSSIATGPTQGLYLPAFLIRHRILSPETFNKGHLLITASQDQCCGFLSPPTLCTKTLARIHRPWVFTCFHSSLEFLHEVSDLQ